MNIIDQAVVLFECILVIMLGLAGTAKLIRPRGFRGTLEKLPWLPNWTVRYLSLLFCLAELAVGVLLTTPLYRVGLIGASILFFMMLVPVGWAVRKAHEITCNCFGAMSSDTMSKGHLLRLMGLAIGSLVPLFVPTEASWASVGLANQSLSIAAVGAFGLAWLQGAALYPAIRRYFPYMRVWR